MSELVSKLVSEASVAIKQLNELVKGGDTDAHRGLGNLYDQLNEILEDEDIEELEEDLEEDDGDWDDEDDDDED